MNPDAIYRRLGELVIMFQWLENVLHQVAWVLIDPEWKDDPRKQTAGLWFRKLLDLVTDRFIAFIDSHDITGAEDYKKRFLDLIEKCKVIADDRNRILHSTFVELKAGGELQGLLRSKIKMVIDDQGDKKLIFDQEHLNEKSFEDFMVQIGEVGFNLGLIHTQLIHWHGSVKPKVIVGSQ